MDAGRSPLVGLGGPSTCWGPWGRSDLVRLVGANAIGLALITIGVYAVAGADSVGAQLRWLNISAAGLVLAGASNGLWLLRCRDVLAEAGLGILIPEGAQAIVASRVGASGADSPQFVAGAGMSHYHRADCPLAMDKAVVAASRGMHEGARRKACEVCEP